MHRLFSMFLSKNKDKFSDLKEIKSKKVLFVSTSVDEVNRTKNGTFLSEIAVPFILLKDK